MPFDEARILRVGHRAARTNQLHIIKIERLDVFDHTQVYNATCQTSSVRATATVRVRMRVCVLHCRLTKDMIVAGSCCH